MAQAEHSATTTIERCQTLIMRDDLIRMSSVFLLLVNGIAAIFGGYTLASDPSGQAMQVSLEFLKNSPFPDYFIPGLILLVVLGGGSLCAALVAILKVRWYPTLVAFMGCVLVAWIVVQMLMLKVLFYLQFIIGGIGILLLALGVIQWRSFVARTEPRTHSRSEDDGKKKEGICHRLLRHAAQRSRGISQRGSCVW